jgi:hypothetical protein
MVRRIAVMALVAACAGMFLPRLHAAAPPTSYRWIAELAASDPAAKAVTVKVAIPQHVAKTLDRFKPGDQIVLVWDMIPPKPPAPATTPAPTPAPNAPPAADKAAAKEPPPGMYTAPLPVALKTETDVLLYIDTAAAMKAAKLDTGYILPAEFVSGDPKTVTVKLKVSDQTLQAFSTIQAGKRFRATSPLHQPGDIAMITEVSAAPAP